MAEERSSDRGVGGRSDPTWDAIRKNWPILLIAISLVAGGVRTEMTIAAHDQEIKEMKKLLNREAFTKFAVWQNNTERDIKDLNRELQMMNARLEIMK
jgi:uncharacterized protein YukE